MGAFVNIALDQYSWLEGGGIVMLLTVLNDLIANKLAIMVEKPGARQLWAMKPSFNSAKQMTSSPRFQSQLGMLSK